MQSAKSILLRMAAPVPCVALAIVVSACDGDKGYRSPTAPLSPTAPPPPTTMPASEEATPGTYRRVTPQFPGIESATLSIRAATSASSMQTPVTASSSTWATIPVRAVGTS
jgi:hypothetical protein